MNARTSFALPAATLALLVAPVTASAQEQDAEEPAAETTVPAAEEAETATTDIIEVKAPPGSLFTDEELARAREVAISNRQRHESYIRANADDDVIVLEPYIVEGDSSLLLARLRWELDQSTEKTRRSMIATDLGVLRELALTRSANDAFFRGPSPGAPEEHVSTGVDMLRAPGAVIEAWKQGRLASIFAAPDPITGN